MLDIASANYIMLLVGIMKIPGALGGMISAVLIESDNTIYVVGQTKGNLDAELNSDGYDMCLLKFDLTGVPQ